MSVPSPLVGEGQGGGAVLHLRYQTLGHSFTPPPQPSPTRGEGVTQPLTPGIELPRKLPIQHDLLR